MKLLTNLQGHREAEKENCVPGMKWKKYKLKNRKREGRGNRCRTRRVKTGGSQKQGRFARDFACQEWHGKRKTDERKEGRKGENRCGTRQVKTGELQEWERWERDFACQESHEKRTEWNTLRGKRRWIMQRNEKSENWRTKRTEKINDRCWVPGMTWEKDRFKNLKR